jgi:hypothetical protein
MSLCGRGRLPLTRTLAELEDLFKKYEKAYKKIDMEAYERYKKDVDVKGNWAIETKIHNYNYTKRRIEHYKKNGTDLLETKKNIVYYSKDKQKVEGTKYEGTAKQKPFLTKKVVEDEKIKKKRVRKVLTDEEKIQAKEARRIKKFDKKELQYLEGKAQLGEKLTTNEKQRLKTIQENFVKLDVEKQKQLLKKKEEAKAKKLDAKYEKMKAYIIDANKRIKKDEPQAQIQEEEEEEEEEEQKPQPSLEDLLGFKAEEVKPIKLLVVPKVVKRITSKEDLKKALTKLKGYNEDIKLHEARLKFIDKTRAKLLKQKGNKNTIEEIDKERDLHTKLLNNAINVLENMRKTIHIEDLKIYKKFIKNPDYFEEEPKPKPQKAKPVKETIIPIEDRLRVVAFEKNKELLAETLRRSGLTKLSKDADPETLLKKFLSVNKERQENIVNYYANIIKEFEEENKTYIEEIAEPTNPIYLVKPAEAIPEYIQPEEEYLNEGGEDEDDEEENIFDSEDYANFIENTELRHDELFKDLEKNYNMEEVKKILIYLKIPYTNWDILSAFRRDYDVFYQMRIGQVRSNTIDLKSKENKKFVRKVNDEISQMLKVLYLLKNPNLI